MDTNKTIFEQYNKDIFNIKKNLIKSMTSEIFYDIINSLEYNINNKSPDFRYGKRYYSPVEEIFKWNSTSPGETKKIFKYNKNLGKYTMDDDIPFVSKKDLTKHWRSVIGINRKLKYYVPDGYLQSSCNIQKANDKTFAFCQKRNSNVIWLDIDNRPNRKATKTLKKFMERFNINPENFFYIEQNLFSGGIHAYIALNKNITDEDFYSKLEKYCDSIGIHIECNFLNNILRLPLSFEYMPFRLTKQTNLDREFVSSKYYINDAKDLFPLDTFEYTDIKNFEFLLKNDFVPTISSNEENKYENYWKTPSKPLFKRTIDNKIKSYRINPITRGNRFEQTKKIVPFLKSQGYSLYDTACIIKENNYDSKDLTNWSIKDIEENIESFYNKCPDSHYIKIKSKDCPFISNEKLVDDDDKRKLFNPLFINLLAIIFVNNYLKARNEAHSYQKHMSNKKISILKKQLPYILIEVFGKAIYDEITKKEFIDDELNYMNGFQISDKFVIKMIKYINKILGLDDNLANWNIQFFKKSLIETLQLFPINPFNYKRNWKKGSCISYILKNIKEKISSLINFVLSNNKNKQNIYNILIGKIKKNESEFINNDYILNYSSIPIPI